MERDMRLLLLITFMATLLSSTLYAQKEVRALDRKGNSYFKKEEYQKAEIEYRKALEISPTDLVANYNLSNTLYKTNRREEAKNNYMSLMENATLSPDQLADVAHNLGNIYMSEKNYAEAIKAYVKSLWERPTDNQTRYNLALAQKLLQQQQQQQQQQQENKDDQNKDNKDKDKNQDNQQEQQQENNNKQDKTQEQEQNAQEKMSKDNAQKILDAFLKDEKDTQQKIDKAKQQKSQSSKNKKQW